MSLLSTLVACCVTGSSAAPTPPVSEESKTLKVGGGCKIDGRSRRQAVQWRPSLCTISEEDVIKTEMIQVYVMPGNKGRKNTRHDFKPSGYKKEFVLRDSWAMVTPMPSSFLF